MVAVALKTATCCGSVSCTPRSTSGIVIIGLITCYDAGRGGRARTSSPARARVVDRIGPRWLPPHDAPRTWRTRLGSTCITRRVHICGGHHLPLIGGYGKLAVSPIGLADVIAHALGHASRTPRRARFRAAIQEKLFRGAAGAVAMSGLGFRQNDKSATAARPRRVPENGAARAQDAARAAHGCRHPARVPSHRRRRQRRDPFGRAARVRRRRRRRRRGNGWAHAPPGSTNASRCCGLFRSFVVMLTLLNGKEYARRVTARQDPAPRNIHRLPRRRPREAQWLLEHGVSANTPRRPTRRPRGTRAHARVLGGGAWASSTRCCSPTTAPTSRSTTSPGAGAISDAASRSRLRVVAAGQLDVQAPSASPANEADPRYVARRRTSRGRPDARARAAPTSPPPSDGSAPCARCSTRASTRLAAAERGVRGGSAVRGRGRSACGGMIATPSVRAWSRAGGGFAGGVRRVLGRPRSAASRCSRLAAERGVGYVCRAPLAHAARCRDARGAWRSCPLCQPTPACESGLLDCRGKRTPFCLLEKFSGGRAAKYLRPATFTRSLRCSPVKAGTNLPSLLFESL